LLLLVFLLLLLSLLFLLLLLSVVVVVCLCPQSCSRLPLSRTYFRHAVEAIVWPTPPSFFLLLRQRCRRRRRRCAAARSEIPLTFRLVPSVWLSAEAGVLSCSDYDTGAPLPTSSAGRTIGAYAHLRVRVTFEPREVELRAARAQYARPRSDDILSGLSKCVDAAVLLRVLLFSGCSDVMVRWCDGVMV